MWALTLFMFCRPLPAAKLIASLGDLRAARYRRRVGAPLARLVSLTALCALALLGPVAGSGGNADTRSLAAYTGLGTWIDIYSPSFRADPTRGAAAPAARGGGPP